MTIKLFSDLGWHTVPLAGSLERLEDGKKTVPMFPKNWRAIYAEVKNDKMVPLGGAITGKVSNIVAVDCDSPDTFVLFKSLDPSYEAIAMSLGKYSEPTGTFIYTYDEELADTFSVNEKHGMRLDFYSDGGFIYLPTEANKTKVPWPSIPEIRQMPASTKMLLKQLAKKNAVVEIPSVVNIMTANCLAPLVTQFTQSKKFMPGLFKIITPKDFRTEPQYITDGYLHPNNVPEGRGSEYLSKVSAILGADVSISEQLYVEAMTLINSLWEDPMDEDVFDKTIMNPMLECNARINGVPIWQHNPDWEEFVCVVPSKRQSTLELGFDDRRNMYYSVDTANEEFKCFGRDSEFISYLEAAAHGVPKRALLKKTIPIVNVVSDPSTQFGFIKGSDPTARDLNLFKQTPELMILKDPESYEKYYKRPVTTIAYLESLVPETKMRDFLLGFVKRKLLTFDYSPVILYFLGVHGSGKDTFVNILENIIGHIARPTATEFLEMFNGWMLDTYFAQLDEYGNQLTKVQDKEEALGKLKAYSGKKTVQIRQMRTDGFQYEHRITFIMTANSQPLVLEDGDRRMAFFATPNKLESLPWVAKAGGIAVVYERILAEIKDFCYYLATEVKELTASEYVKPAESQHKHKLIADSMYASQKIVYCIKHKMWQYLIDLSIENSVPAVEADLRAQRITTASLEELYSNITDFKGDFKAVVRQFKASGLTLKPTVKHGSSTYYADVEIPPFIGEDDSEFEEVKL